MCAARLDLDESTSAGIGTVFAGGERTFFKAAHLHISTDAAQGMDCRIKRAIAFTADQQLAAIDFERKADALALAAFKQLMVDIAHRSAGVEISRLEQLPERR